jgi:hypothetical protein
MAVSQNKLVCVGGGVPFYPVVDEDTLASDLDTAIPTQQSVKAYYDAGVASSSTGAGTKNGATVAAAEYGNGILHKTVLTLTATPITLTDDAGVGQSGGVKLYDMPAGDIVVLGVVSDSVLTLVGTEWLDTAEGDFAFGSAVVSGGGSMTGTEVDIMAQAAWGPATAQVSDMNGGAIATAYLAKAGTTDLDVYLNVRVDDNAAHITSSGTITGTVTLTWINQGDF